MSEGYGDVSRRRILQGAAWATPAIVLATSVPARAASGDPGALALTDVGANLTTGFLTATGTVLYAGSTGSAPVDPVMVSIVVPASVVANDVPVVGTGFWEYLTTSVEGSNKVFTFRYRMGAISESLPFTHQLQATIARNNGTDFTPVTVTVRANGTSLAVPVPQDSVTVTTSVGAQIIFNVTPPMQTQPNYLGQGPAYVFYGQVRWNGPYWPVGANVTGVNVVVRIPAANSTTDLFIPTLGAGWTQVGEMELIEDYRRVQFSYALPIGSTSASTTDLQFGILSATNPPVLNVATIRAEGLSAADGSGVFTQYTGPAVQYGSVRYRTDGEFPTPGSPPPP